MAQVNTSDLYERDSKRRKHKPSFAGRHSFAADKAAKRVIAPYVNIIRRGHRAAMLRRVKERTFSFYLQKKPSLLMRTLKEFLSDTSDIPMLLSETADAIKSFTMSTGVRLYMVDPMVNTIYLSTKNISDARLKQGWPIEEGTTVAAYVAAKKEYVLVDDVLNDARFPDGLNHKDSTAKAVLSVPIVMADDTCYAVIELYRDVTLPVYSKADLKTAVVVTGWMGAAIYQNLEKMSYVKKQQFGDYLSQLTLRYFSEPTSFDRWIFEMISFAKETMVADRSTFFVVEKYAKDEYLADVYEEGVTTGQTQLVKRNVKMHLKKDKSVHAYVARTQELLNIGNIYADDRFTREVDQKTGFIARSVLVAPIKGYKELLGIFELTNKSNGASFNKDDEELINVFCIYFALGLHLQKVNKSYSKEATSSVNNSRILKWHLKPCKHEIDEFDTFEDVAEPVEFNEFHWYYSIELKDMLPQLSLRMIVDIVGPECIDYKQMKLFILVMRKSYRDNPYHNWDHAVNVCHCMMNIIKRNRDTFSHLESEALIIAALSHDVDHGGFTNNFLSLSNDPLIQLYNESPWENHHYYLTMVILKDYVIFKDITPENFPEFNQNIKEAILATDLALYFRCRAKLTPIIMDGMFNWANPIHRQMGKAIMMTTCDLSGQCKKFSVAKRLTDGLYHEFYNQGDIEISMDLIPLSMMDREKQHKVPEDQINFLQIIVMPCCDLLNSILPNTTDCLTLASQLRDTWRQIIDMHGLKVWKQVDSLVAVHKE